MKHKEVVEKIYSLPSGKHIYGGGLTLEKAVAYPEGIAIIEMKYTGNMGYSMDAVNTEVLRVLGMSLKTLRMFSFSHSEEGSPDYLWTGSYRVQI